MSEHLPECDATDCGCTPEEECGPNCINLCICDRLRQAEQRGKLIQSAVEMDTSVINQNRSYDKGYKKGREDAARDVEALRNRWNGQHDVVQLNAAVAAARGEQA